MLEEDWDNEVNETQDEFNTSKFDSIEAQKQLESEDLQHKKEKQQAIQIKREAEEDPYGFTAKRNAMKAAEQSKIKSNPVKKVPPVTVEEEVPVPIKPTNTAAGAKISKVGSTGPSKSRIVDPALKAFFEESESKTFSEQAIDFLNAYWPEVGDQAEFIFSAAHKMFVHADMHTKGITLHHLYTEGNAVDYNVAAYFYEKLYHFLHSTKEGKVFRDDPTYAPSMIEMKTAIQLKEDFREKVDVSFDGKISFLEHLLYQYNNVANPRDYMMRRQAMESEHEVIRKAREALEDINAQVRKYEEKRKELEEGSKQPGVKGKSFQHQLSMLDASPLAEALQKSLITAEAAVRLAVKHFKGQTSKGAGSVPEGSLWWMKRELKAKKEVVVPNTLRRIKAA